MMAVRSGHWRAEGRAFQKRSWATITPAVAENVLRHLPQWKLEFTQINAPKFPHLVDQLEFLADAVEDATEGAYKELPFVAVAQAVFALLYAHKKMGIIPETHFGPGRRGQFQRRARRADPERKSLRHLRRQAGRGLAQNHQPGLIFPCKFPW
jgi:hypothetical protein